MEDLNTPLLRVCRSGRLRRQAGRQKFGGTTYKTIVKIEVIERFRRKNGKSKALTELFY